jgi:hypothetical protein
MEISEKRWRNQQLQYRPMTFWVPNLDVKNPTMRVPNSYASSFLKGLVMKWVAI